MTKSADDNPGNPFQGWITADFLIASPPTQPGLYDQGFLPCGWADSLIALKAGSCEKCEFGEFG